MIADGGDEVGHLLEAAEAPPSGVEPLPPPEADLDAGGEDGEGGRRSAKTAMFEKPNSYRNQHEKVRARGHTRASVRAVDHTR